MTGYQFVIPRDAPGLTYPVLTQITTRHRAGQYRNAHPPYWPQIGSTVTLYDGYGEPGAGVLGDATVPPQYAAMSAHWVSFVLYRTSLAIIGPEGVVFTVHGYRTQATGGWLSQIACDNGLGYRVWAEHGGYLIDGQQPFEGDLYHGGGGRRPPD